MNEVLNCDAADCDHVEPVGTITVDMVDMPCPSCGSNLLTAEDWAAWQPYSALLKSVDTAINPNGDEGRVAVRVGLHGPKTTIQFDRSTDHNKETE